MSTLKHEKYLLIENRGLCSPDEIVLLGISPKDPTSNPGLIGQFGTGAKYAIACLLRHKLPPIIFSGRDRYSFDTQKRQVRGKSIDVVILRTKNDWWKPESVRELGFVADLGKRDWTQVCLALRELGSNAIDEEVRRVGDTGGEPDWDFVRPRIVTSKDVTGLEGRTRAFVPADNAVKDFEKNLDRWFLHFSEPQNLTEGILSKENRNFFDNKSPVIYRRGVRVREFKANDTPSLFDYNLEMQIDEARVANDPEVRNAAGQALANSGEHLATVLQTFRDGDEYWEHQLDTESLKPSLQLPGRKWSEIRSRRGKIWKQTFESRFGSTYVLASQNDDIQRLEKKGHDVVPVPPSFEKAAEFYKVHTASSVLVEKSDNRRVLEETPKQVKNALESLWYVLERLEMTRSRSMPEIKCFESLSDAESQLQGFYEKRITYVNANLVGDGTDRAFSRLLLMTVLEELSHYITGSADKTRDFQNYLLQLSIGLLQQTDIWTHISGSDVGAVVEEA